jgi:phage terminase small subunit
MRKTDEEKQFLGTEKKSRKKVSKTIPLQRMIKPAFELTKEANNYFKATLKMLMSAEAVTALDVYSVTMFAYWFALFVKTDKEAEGKFIQEFKGGSNNINAAASMIKLANTEIKYYIKVLGLSPKDRQSIIAFAEEVKEDEDNPLDMIAEMLKGEMNG